MHTRSEVALLAVNSNRVALHTVRAVQVRSLDVVAAMLSYSFAVAHVVRLLHTRFVKSVPSEKMYWAAVQTV
jgi:hypothetical protein